MMPPRLMTSASRLFLVLLIAFSAVSCAHWRQQWVGPERVIEKQHPSQVQVTTKSGAQFVLRNPAVVLDSLVGVVDGEHQAIGLENIDHLSLRRGRSLLPAVLIPLAVITGVGILFALTWD